jgi:hypothetical protein
MFIQIFNHIPPHPGEILPEECLSLLGVSQDKLVRQGAKLSHKNQSLQAEIGRLEGENKKLTAQCEKLKNSPPAGDGSLALKALLMPTGNREGICR